MEIYNSIVIDKPIEEVFEFLANFENMPRWNYYVVEVRKTTSGSIALGTTFHQTRKSDSQDYKIIELNFPYSIATETLPPERHIVMRFKLSREGTSTRLEDEIKIKAPWIISIFIRKKIQSAILENLGKLKILLEQGQVQLQDGRTVFR